MKRLRDLKFIAAHRPISLITPLLSGVSKQIEVTAKMEQEIARLRMVLEENPIDTSEIDEYLDWVKKEYQKIETQRMSDNEAMGIIVSGASHGLTLTESIEGAKKYIKSIIEPSK